MNNVYAQGFALGRGFGLAMDALSFEQWMKKVENAAMQLAPDILGLDWDDPEFRKEYSQGKSPEAVAKRIAQ